MRFKPSDKVVCISDPWMDNAHAESCVAHGGLPHKDETYVVEDVIFPVYIHGVPQEDTALKLVGITMVLPYLGFPACCFRKLEEIKAENKRIEKERREAMIDAEMGQ